MAIQPVSPQSYYDANTILRDIRNAQTAEARPLDGQEQTSGRTEGEHGSHGRAHGVLRRLEQGHFSGVADARLRINFFQQLKARAQQRSEAVAQQQVTGLSDQVDQQLQGLLDAGQLDQDTLDAAQSLRTDFGQSLDTALQSFGDNHDTTALGESVGSAFDTFVSGLRSLLTPTTDSDGDADGGAEGTAGDVDGAATPDVSAGDVAPVDGSVATSPAGDAGAVVPTDATPAAPSGGPSATDGPSASDAAAAGGSTAGSAGDAPAAGDAQTAAGGVEFITDKTIAATPDQAIDLPAQDAAQTRDPATDAQPAGTTTPDQTGADPFADLASAFQDALANALDAIDSAGKLADPSRVRHHHRHHGDHGHNHHDNRYGFGRAFDKFSSIFNQLRSGSVDEAG